MYNKIRFVYVYNILCHRLMNFSSIFYITFAIFFEKAQKNQNLGKIAKRQVNNFCLLYSRNIERFLL